MWTGRGCGREDPAIGGVFERRILGRPVQGGSVEAAGWSSGVATERGSGVVTPMRGGLFAVMGDVFAVMTGEVLFRMLGGALAVVVRGGSSTPGARSWTVKGEGCTGAMSRRVSLDSGKVDWLEADGIDVCCIDPGSA